MLMSSSFTGGQRTRERTPDIFPDPSCSGVNVTLSGWSPGFNKVRLTQMVRDGGLASESRHGRHASRA